jgi:hypothetical protein
MATRRRKAFGSEVAASEFIFQSTDGAKRRVRARVGKPDKEGPLMWRRPSEIRGLLVVTFALALRRRRRFGKPTRRDLIDMVESGNYPYGVGDNPLTDMFRWGKHPFPPDIEQLLRKIGAVDASDGRVPLGQNWPYAGREWGWAGGQDLDGARRDLRHLLAMIEAGRGDEVLVDPITRKPLRSP